MTLTNISRTISLIGAFVLTLTTARAVSPPPDGGYPSFCTAEGEDALFSFTFPLGVQSNTAIGYQALYSDTVGGANTAVGSGALRNNISGNQNTGIGVNTLNHNTTGGQNIAVGESALQNNTTGIDNTATGLEALQFNTTGINNTAGGYDALLNNTTGSNNTATGWRALFNNTADGNTANGYSALLSNTTGGTETAVGFNSLSSNTTGEDNTAVGYSSLSNNISGFGNTAVGVLALFETTAPNNTAAGCFALQNDTTGFTNTAVGQAALINNTTGAQNIALGAGAGFNLTSGNNNIDIGNMGVAGESAKIRIGTKPAQKAAFIAGISGVTVANGVGVIINSQGQLGTVVSSARFKEGIEPMDKASEAILALKPVTFRYKHELDPEGIPQFGLVAEQVEKVDPNLVARDDNGNPYTVRYEAVNAMLLNEFLKEHRRLEDLEATVAKLQSVVQKVSNQIELTKPAPQMVDSN